MINFYEVAETNQMIEQENLDEEIGRASCRERV